MKTKTPEKIYLYSYPTDGIYEVETKPLEGTVEYTRTDYFIERVINFLNYKLDDVVVTRLSGTIIPHHVAKQELIEDFRNYMKGE